MASVNYQLYNLEGEPLESTSGVPLEALARSIILYKPMNLFQPVYYSPGI